MDDIDSRPRSVTDSFFRLVGLVILVIVGVWLAFRVIAGVVHFFVWLLTTAVIVAVILAALFLVMRGSGRRD